MQLYPHLYYKLSIYLLKYIINYAQYLYIIYTGQTFFLHYAKALLHLDRITAHGARIRTQGRTTAQRWTATTYTTEKKIEKNKKTCFLPRLNACKVLKSMLYLKSLDGGRAVAPLLKLYNIRPRAEFSRATATTEKQRPRTAKNLRVLWAGVDSLPPNETKRAKRAQAGRLAGIVKKTYSGRDKTRPTAPTG